MAIIRGESAMGKGCVVVPLAFACHKNHLSAKIVMRNEENVVVKNFSTSAANQVPRFQFTTDPTVFLHGYVDPIKKNLGVKTWPK